MNCRNMPLQMRLLETRVNAVLTFKVPIFFHELFDSVISNQLFSNMYNYRIGIEGLDYFHELLECESSNYFFVKKLYCKIDSNDFESSRELLKCVYLNHISLNMSICNIGIENFFFSLHE